MNRKRSAVKAMPYGPTTEEKRDVMSAILYEIEQLMEASSVKADQPFVNNALIESVLLHARALLDFYEKPSRGMRWQGSQKVEMDDVLAADYGFAAREIDMPSDARERLNKDLAHLTYARAGRKPQDKLWDYGRVVRPILERSREFLEHVRDCCPHVLTEEVMRRSKTCIKRTDLRLRRRRD